MNTVAGIHLFFATLVLVVAAVWVQNIPDGAIYFVVEDTSAVPWDVRAALTLRWLGWVVLAAFGVGVAVARARLAASGTYIMWCWATLAVAAAWVAFTVWTLWPAMEFA